ncbi:MAG TPA: substrate-binding domain-containing protein [Sorangium sp.]|nr:substrate-binding domain-containing protein [Sorangium sp.]
MPATSHWYHRAGRWFSHRRQRIRGMEAGLLVGLASVLSASCASEAPGHPESAVVIGALLPFSGSESAIGRNLEQAMLLAVDDLNAAGGLDGRPFDILSRDSHSSSERGFEQLVELLYTDHVAYVVGPEENDLARDIAPDVKVLDTFHMLPGYAAPSVARSETRGGWMRLAPSPLAVGCALAKVAVREGVRTVNSLAARDDHSSRVSSEFTTKFAVLGGRALPSETFAPGEQTYVNRIESAFAWHADRTLLSAYPAAASTIVTEWTLSGRPGTWLLGPALRTEVFLANIPTGSLDGYVGVSPSLSLRSECHTADDARETVDCADGNAAAFSGYFARRWGGEGNVLGSVAQSGDIPESEELQTQQIRQAVADGVKGIGIAPYGDAQAAALDEAMAKGVEVVTLDTDLASSKRSIYVGTLNKSAGATAGETLLAMLPPPPGTVMIHGNDNPGWVDGLDRTQGARDVFEAAGYEVLVRSATWDATGEAQDVEWMKTRLETSDPPVVGLIGLFNVSYRCAMAAEAARKADLPIVAFDFDPKTVDYMRAGRIKATHTQRQYYEGYLVPYILYGIEAIGLDATREILAPQLIGESRVNTGLDVVPGDKIDAYYDFLSSIGAN